MSKQNRILYWVVTGLLAFGMAAQGIAQTVGTKAFAGIFAQLGYPGYLLSILGIWKLLGVAAILAPGLPRLKEWAYAGFFFVMTGAALSHLLAGRALAEAAPGFVMTLLIVLSWYLRPPDRKLISSPQPATG